MPHRVSAELNSSLERLRGSPVLYLFQFPEATFIPRLTAGSVRSAPARPLSRCLSPQLGNTLCTEETWSLYLSPRQSRMNTPLKTPLTLIKPAESLSPCKVIAGSKDQDRASLRGYDFAYLETLKMYGSLGCPPRFLIYLSRSRTKASDVIQAF